LEIEMDGMIDIAGLDKAEVLAALFNASKQQGMGFFDTSGAGWMSVDDARKCIDVVTDSDGEIYFDYLRGRVMKVELSGDQLNPRLYDRDNGRGAADAALAGLVAARSI
jgi:hypothetical protein